MLFAMLHSGGGDAPEVCLYGLDGVAVLEGERSEGVAEIVKAHPVQDGHHRCKYPGSG